MPLVSRRRWTLGQPSSFRALELYSGFVVWGNIRVVVGLYRDNGKLHGNYYLGFRV